MFIPRSISGCRQRTHDSPQDQKATQVCRFSFDSIQDEIASQPKVDRTRPYQADRCDD
ncbi:hypothetical protein PGT21_036905 [Puccinia graminis f. sp. tritici]|nr:hypothetical protein PGT21_036905 [Puccinia graminis f. sp. tritici]